MAKKSKEFTVGNIVVKSVKVKGTKRYDVSITFTASRKLNLKEILLVTNEAIPATQFIIARKRTVKIKYKK